jgi:drug/metabolite transporter (DMT)-like permease
MLVGCAGAALLVAPDALRAGSTGSVLKGFLILQLGCLCWSLGSVLQRRQRGVTHPLVSSGVQQLAAGLAAVLPAALMSGQGIDWKTRPVAALLYLVVFGSIVGYSCYVYALHHLPVPIVSIYNYVNPVVAVALGWLFYREPFGPRETVAMLIIFVGVTLVKRSTPASPSSELSHRTRRPRWIPS